MKKVFIPFNNRRFVHMVGAPTCGAETLPEVDFNFCEPDIKLSEIQRVFIGKIGSEPFNDWTQAEEWTERMSESSTSINAIRPLTVIGDKPAPAATKKEISNARKINTRKDHTLNFTVDEVTATNHEFLQGVEGGKRFRLWYETAGGLMFGGNNGIPVELTGDMVLKRGAGEIMGYEYVATWISPTTESRCDSPIFGETTLGSAVLDTTVVFATDATPTEGDCDFVLNPSAINAVAQFSYNNINPTIGAPIVMNVKVGGTLKLTANMTADFIGHPFTFKDTLGALHSGLIAAGDVLF